MASRWIGLLARLWRRLSGARPARSQEAIDAATIARLRSRGVRIGDGCRIYTDDFSTEPYLVTIGNGVGISGGVKFLTHDGSAHLLRRERRNIQFLGTITVGDDCFIGENALLLPGSRLGNGCVVGAGSVVFGDIPPNSLVAGNPGRVIGRASLLLRRLASGPNALDTYGMAEPQRRLTILRHFGTEGDIHD